MAPKKRTVKKSKNALTRGRPAKQPKEEEIVTTTTTTSETEDNASEHQQSPIKIDIDVTNKGSSRTSPAATTLSDAESAHGDRGTKKEPWDDLPNLIDELRDGDTITYITNINDHRTFELEARRELLQQHIDFGNLRSNLDSSLTAMRKLCPDVRNGKISDAISALGYPTTFRDLMVKLSTLSTSQLPQINVFEESQTEDKDTLGVPYMGSNLCSNDFPCPSEMTQAKYYTPKHQGPSVFQFGTGSKGLSTNKAARLAKPGEIMYSEGGSPILQRRVPDKKSAQTLERVEVYQPDGTKIEVDIVYRGGKDVEKLRGFKEFARDVRGIAASRATSVRQNRVQPPKIVKAGSQSASKLKSNTKPEWR